MIGDDTLKEWGPSDFAWQIILPGLEAINHHDEAGMVLVLGTAIQESKLKYIRQIHGPALGYFQMEPATHNDLWSRWLGPSSRSYIVDGLRMLTKDAGDPQALVSCPQYAAAMCRIKYLSIPGPVPKADDVLGMAEFYKKWYNTPAGAATIPEAVKSFGKAVAALYRTE